VPMTSGGHVSAVPLNEVFCVAVLSLPLGGNGSEIDCAPLTLTSGGGVCAVPQREVLRDVCLAGARRQRIRTVGQSNMVGCRTVWGNADRCLSGRAW
jgi:hypothetical protein